MGKQFHYGETLFAGIICLILTMYASNSAILEVEAKPLIEFGICVDGLNAGAEVERQQDASDHEATISFLQKAIIAYGKCIDDMEGVNGDKQAIFSYERAKERTYLVEEFIDAKRSDDAKIQAGLTIMDLYNACGKYEKIGASNVRELQLIVAPSAIKDADLFGLNPSVLIDRCHIDQSKFPY